MLEIQNLSKTYANGTRALDNVSLSIPNGMFGLLGPNGAGKSTLIRTIATLQEPDKGELLFSGTNIRKKPESLRKQLGYLPQEFGVYPKVSALDLLDHIAVLKGVLKKKERREQVEALLQLTNLHAHRKKAVSTFSGGMRQRFGIAQALLGNPKLIVVDEPTAGLDPQERNRFLNMLSEIGTNVVVLLSTHIVEDVRNLCSRMAILAGGKILSEGVPEVLIAELSGRLWKKTIEKEAEPAYRKAYNVISSKLFAGRTIIHVIADIHPNNGFEAAKPDLEDVYFSTLLNN
ncbi:MAG: ABC transporter ATP-binding protein [Calditrichia bacterium]